MPVCSNCGSQQPDGAVFCDECGAGLGEAAPAQTPPPMGVACPVCGAPVVPGEPFCDHCGAALGAAPPQTVAPAQSSPPYGGGTGGGESVCPNCGAPLEPDSNFCDMCGAPVSAAAPPPSLPTPAPAPSVAPAPPPVQGRLAVQGTRATLSFPPGKTEILVGREDPVSGVFPDVDLTDHGGDEGGVSRRHARIFVQGIQVFIEDLNSTNYTYVNQQKLAPGQPQPLNDGDEVRLGRLKLNFYT